MCGLLADGIITPDEIGEFSEDIQQKLRFYLVFEAFTAECWLRILLPAIQPLPHPLPFGAPDYPHLDMKKYHLTSERSNVGRKAKNEDLHDLGEVERLFLAPDLGRFDLSEVVRGYRDIYSTNI
jgi:hypothetical protein